MRSSPARRNPWRKVQAVALLVGLGVFVVNPAISGAGETLDAVNAGARADGLRIRYSIKKFLIVEDFIDAGGPVARASLNPTGSESFAALPDPGATVIGYNTVVGLVTGQGLPAEYPFYAQATFPGAPEQATADPAGSYQVAARAGAGSAESVARMRPSQGDTVVSGAVATSNISSTGDAVKAVAETKVDGVSLSNGAVKLAGIVSRSVTTRTAGRAEAETETSLEIEGITVNDLKVRYGPKGFELAGSPVPVPAETVKDALDGALEPLGIELDVTDPARVADGAGGAVLELRQSYQLPAGESRMSLSFGGTSTSVTAAAPGIDADLGGGVDPGPVAGGPAPDAGSGPAPGDPTTAGASSPSPDHSAIAPAAAGAPPGSYRSGSSAAPTSGAGSGSGGSSPAPSSASFTAGPGDAPSALPTGARPGLAADGAGQEVALATQATSSTSDSVEGPFAALVAGGLGVVLIAAEWARRSANAAMWLGQ